MTTMIKKRVFSVQTRNNILLDIFLLISGLISVLSGIYFLFLPVGGFMGGRNPFYGVIIFFERHTWSDIHIWASVIIMALAALHIPLHWQWIVKMSKTGFRSMFGKSRLNKFSRFNLIINILFGISGLICGLSGLYFLLVPAAHGSAAVAPVWIFTPLVWDLVHTWSGVIVTAVAILHFGIHWKWVVKVLNKYWKALVENNPFKQLDQNLGTSIVSVDDSL
ncbi:MAG: DUF4405 domain-containing protein [Chloroflexi bacterium]|nr:DUF4405 domain-containing protein [Chloroflexota bacterium]